VGSARSLIQGLDTLEYDGLCELWHELYGRKPPAYNRVFLVNRLSYRIQENAFGGLSDWARKEMKRLLRSKNPHRRQAAGLPIAGTRFVRDWNGQRYEVTVTATGFEYDGRAYRSLSAIANQITGTHWNGRAFFGIAQNGGRS